MYISVPHHLNILVFLYDNIELEPWPDGEGETKLWDNIHVELVLLLVRAEARHGGEEGGVRLVEVGVGESNGGSFG